MRVCSVDDCGFRAIKKGLCDKHYKRIWRNGTLECSNTPPQKASTREEIRDYNHLLRLAYPEKNRESVRRWRMNNRERIRNYERQLRIDNPNYNQEKRAKNPEAYRKLDREWRAKNSDRLSQKAKTRRSTDVNHKLRMVLRCRMNQALRKGWKSGSAIRLLGCSIDSFKIYLESKFDVGMSWDNHGKGLGKWNIDHEIPCALFDLSKPERQERCFHFSNLQPMWATENASKGARVLP